MLKKIDIKKIIRTALQEDAPNGDITSRFFGDKRSIASAKIIAKEEGVLAGIDVAEKCFSYIDRHVIFKKFKKDGDYVKKGSLIAAVKGNTDSILLAERTALNFLQHLSGIATQTNKLTKLIRKTKTTLLDTRKTLPGLRNLEKYAVVCGGGKNHRLNLSDMALIKENHLSQLNLTILKDKLNYFQRKKPGIKIEIEAANLTQVKDFLELPVDVILLDNFTIAQLRQALNVRRRLKKQIPFEASGNISAKNISAVAKTGVEYISCGSITHSAPAMDFSLLME